MKKKHKKNLNIYSTWIIIFISIPIIFYLLNFGENGFSFKSTNWSEFGSFIGGYGTLIFSAANLYFLIKVAYSINHLDDKRNEKNYELEEIRNKQNKIDSVVPYLITTTFNHEINNEIVLKIKNCGIGPSIIVDCRYFYNDKEYSEIKPIINLITSGRILAKVNSYEISEGSAISVNSEMLIFEIKMYQHERQNNKSYTSAVDYVLEEISKIKGSVTYTDLYKSENFILEIKDYEL